MQTVKFKFQYSQDSYDYYDCDSDGNKSGEYVSIAVANELLEALEEIYWSGEIQQAEIVSGKMLPKYRPERFRRRQDGYNLVRIEN